MKQCIICKKFKEDDEFNIEHVIPESMGGSFIINNVCKKCNNYLGRIDSYAINNFISLLYINQLKIRNKKEKIKSPWPKTISKINSKIKANPKISNDGEFLGYEYKTILISDNDKYILEYYENKDIETIINDANNLFSKKFHRKMNEEEIKSLKEKIKNKEYKEIKQELMASGTLDLRRLCLEFIKIAYEIGHYTLGNDYFNDSLGEEYRKILINDKKFNQTIINNLSLQINLCNEETYNLIRKLNQMINKNIIHMIRIIPYNNELVLNITILKNMSLSIKVTDNLNNYDFNEINLIFMYYENDKGSYEQLNMDRLNYYISEFLNNGGDFKII